MALLLWLLLLPWLASFVSRCPPTCAHKPWPLTPLLALAVAVSAIWFACSAGVLESAQPLRARSKAAMRRIPTGQWATFVAP